MLTKIDASETISYNLKEILFFLICKNTNWVYNRNYVTSFFEKGMMSILRFKNQLF